MTDRCVRTLDPAEHRLANRLFRAALHVPPAGDDEWDRAEGGYQPGRVLGAFESDVLVGTARSFDAELTVPGDRRLALAAVTGVGVRADRTRRGVLGDLMRYQFADLAARGVPVASLHATEGLIYGRFGYGIATTGKSYTVDRGRARLRPEVPEGGEVEILDPGDAPGRLPEVYAALPHPRPGMMTRPPHWWPGFRNYLAKSEFPMVTALHRSPFPGGPRVDGFVVYHVENRQERRVLVVNALHAAGTDALAGLWRFLLRVDLVDEIQARTRPCDEPAELLFTDPRACRVTGIEDETWLRLVDVAAALSAREYDGEPMVLEVRDPVLPGNSGRYRVGPGGVERTGAVPELELAVDSLAMVYLGGWRPSALAAVGRIRAQRPGALARADRLLASTTSAWCGTFF
jgi:predicted acetyltransferase